jgi:exodeoxyribonuclease-3
MNSVKLYSWNVNGLRAVVKKGAFEEFIKIHKPDILGLQETRAIQGQAEIDLPAYQEFWNSAHKKGYSGTAVFTKIKPVSVAYDLPEEIIKKYSISDDGYGDPIGEGRVTTAEFDSFYYVSVYTPNSKDDLSRLKLRHEIWDPAFLAYCQQLEAHKPVIISGDFNVAHTEDDIANPKPNVGKHGFTLEERHGFQNFIDAGFIDAFRLFIKGNGHYTWWSHWANARERNVGWRIDYFLVSKALKNKVKAAKIHPEIMGSDHCPISLELSL